MERVNRKQKVILPDVFEFNETLINAYFVDAECRSVTSRTIDNYESCLRIFYIFIEKSLMNVDIDDLTEFLAYLKNKKNKNKENYSYSTISRYFSAINSFYSFMEFKKYIKRNIVPQFIKWYLSPFKRKRYSNVGSRRKLISVEEMSMLVNSIMDPRDKSVALLAAKTGLRRLELSNIDVEDINWMEQCIHLKPTSKRSNLDVFFDDECARMLKRWMVSRENRANNGTKALFLNERGGRLGRNAIYELVVKHATKVGLHNPNSYKIQDRFTMHCCRHWFTTWLIRNGMNREYVKELRGDSRNEAIDIYHHIDRKELRDSYLVHIPQLGID